MLVFNQVGIIYLLNVTKKQMDTVHFVGSTTKCKKKLKK